MRGSEGGRGKEGERKREREREREGERERGKEREGERERRERDLFITYFPSLQLHIASANGYYRIAKLLLDGGAGIDVLDDLGYTPLHVAAKFNQVN